MAGKENPTVSTETIPDYVKLFSIQECNSIVESGTPINREVRIRFARNFLALTKASSTREGLFRGNLNDIDSKGLAWEIQVSCDTKDGNYGLSFYDQNTTYHLELSRKDDTVDMHAISDEEGFHAWNTKLSPNQTREWFRRAVDVYKTSELPWNKHYDLWQNSSELRRVQRIAPQFEKPIKTLYRV